MMQCPQCEDVFDVLEPGTLVMGGDEKGIYIEHTPCGFRGRPAGGGNHIEIVMTVPLEY